MIPVIEAVDADALTPSVAIRLDLAIDLLHLLAWPSRAARLYAARPCRCCYLTPSAEALLERAARDLAASRGEDRTWSIVRCPRCGRISTVIDHRAGAEFGPRSPWSELEVTTSWEPLETLPGLR